MTLSRAASPSTQTPLGRRFAASASALAIAAAMLGIGAGVQLATAATGTVGGTVFLDGNADGAIGSEESGVEGLEVVAVDRSGNRSVRVATAADGSYQIDLAAADGTVLEDGPYRIEFGDLPALVHESPIGIDNGSSVQFVAAGADDVSLGLVDLDPSCAGRPSPGCGDAPLHVGNRIWFDRDADGTQDADEPGVNGVTVQLIDADGTIVGETTSGGDGLRRGEWTLAMVPRAEHTLRFDPSTATDLPYDIVAADLHATLARAGDAATDSDIDPDGQITILAEHGHHNDHGFDAGFSAVPVTPTLDVAVSAGTKWSPAETPVGYIVEVHNDGPDPITNVVVTDTAVASCARGPFDLVPDERRSWECELTPAAGIGRVSTQVIATGTWVARYGPDLGTATTLRDVDAGFVRVAAPAIGLHESTSSVVPQVADDQLTTTYEVVNEGDVDLALGTPARISDDRCDSIVDTAFHPTAGAPFNVGDTDADGILDVAADAAGFDDSLGRETWQYVCVTEPALDERDRGRDGVPLDTRTSTVTVVATPVEPDGEPTGLGDVSRQDSSTVDLLGPSVRIETQVRDDAGDWRNADALDGEAGADARPVPHYLGTRATVRHVVTNNGTTPLISASVIVDGVSGPGCDRPIPAGTVLRPSETITVAGDGTCEIGALDDPGTAVVVVGTVVATPADDAGVAIAGLDPVRDEDPAVVRVVIASVTIEAVPAVQTIVDGSTGTWRFHVRNRSTGIPALSNVMVTGGGDGVGCRPLLVSGDADGDDRLDRAETWIVECDVVGVSTPGSVSATVIAEVPSGQPQPPTSVGDGVTTLTDSATATHAVGAVALQKQVRTRDGDWADHATVAVDDTVEFRVVTSNPGSVPVIGLVIADDRCTLELEEIAGDRSGLEAPADQLRILSPEERWVHRCTDQAASAGATVGTTTIGGAFVAETPDDDARTAESALTAGTAIPSTAASASFEAVAPRLVSTVDIIDGRGGTGDPVVLAAGATTTIVHSLHNASETWITEPVIAGDLANDRTRCAPWVDDVVELGPGDLAVFTCEHVVGRSATTLRALVVSARARTIDGHLLPFIDTNNGDAVSYQVAALELEQAVVVDGKVVDADTAGGAAALMAGQTATMRFSVTNTGDVSLGDVSVSDLAAGVSAGPDCSTPIRRTAGDGTELAVGATWAYECSSGPVRVQEERTARVSARAVDPRQSRMTVDVRADDPAFIQPIEPASLGDRIWFDGDADGVQDDGEPGLAGIEVTLLDAADSSVASTTTSDDGSYGFDGLIPGVYRIRVDVPAGHEVSPPSAGGDDARDSDLSVDGNSAFTTLDPGENDVHQDAGLFEASRLGDRIWLDLDADGVQEVGEPGLEDVEVRLMATDGAEPEEVASTRTDADGRYAFAGLAPGMYRVRVIVPGGHRPSPADQGGDDSADSDINADGESHEISVGVTAPNRDIDAGLHQPAGVRVHAWIDRDRDGGRGESEPDLTGALVRLLDPAGVTLATATTDEAGTAAFGELAPGRYEVESVAPAGMEPTTEVEKTIDLTSGRIDTGLDAGFVVATIVMSSPETNLSSPDPVDELAAGSDSAATGAPAALAITGRTTYLFLGLAMLLLGSGASTSILAVRLRGRGDDAMA